MYGLGVNKLGVTNVSGGFNPLSLFANGEQGAWYDPSDLTTVFQPDGTTPTVPWVSGAVTDANRVGKLVDKSRANGHDLIQTSSAKCPTLVSAGGLYYLDFDGDDGLRTTLDLPFGTNTVNEMSVFAAGEFAASGSTSNLVELSNNIGSNAGAFRLFKTSGDIIRSIQKGTQPDTAQTTSVSIPHKSVLSSVADISAPSHLFRSNGSVVEDTTPDLGTGNYSDLPLNMGARSDGASAQLDGKIYGVVIVGKKTNSGEIDNTEAYLASKSGVTL
tara:strand:- start:18795 stop:19613 length:819 start_codon:yes stop_codon:yes gene_type:complete